MSSRRETPADRPLPSGGARSVSPLVTFVVAVLFAGVVAGALRIAWNPSAKSYLEYVPIGAVFAAFLCDRGVLCWSEGARCAAWDALIVALALMRVFIPPLLFVSGHTLFASYAALTARRWPLRALAVLVLAEVMYVKVFASGGWRSMLGGLAVAGVAGAARRRVGCFAPARVRR
jgi:hypothetical protein